MHKLQLNISKMQILMMISLVIILSALNAVAIDEPLKKMLPEKIRNFEIKKTSVGEINRVLGKAGDTKRTKGLTILFYNLSGRDYDTTLSIKDGKLYYLIYNIEPGVHKLKEVEPYVDAKLISDGLRNMREAPPSHDKGRYFFVMNRDLGYQFRITNTPNRDIDQIFIWVKGESKP